MLACEGICCVDNGLHEDRFAVGRTPARLRSIGEIRTGHGKRCQSLLEQDQ